MPLRTVPSETVSSEIAPDEIFANPRLAPLYDPFDADRADLDHYVAIATEFGAKSVLDLGCGTGTFACQLVPYGIDVIGVDPAQASLEVARTKPDADQVQWIVGTTSSLSDLGISALPVDMITMTGNVAQVFTSDTEWNTTLSDLASVVKPTGTLVFETRVPERRAWEEWTRFATHQRLDIAGIGFVETWVEVKDIALPLVSFCHTYRFESDGTVLTSDSTLRFRNLEEIEASLADAGWMMTDVREAPDRPGKEHVVIAQPA